MPQFIRILLLLLFSSYLYASAQDTFSIVAVDSVTGEIGSAGASCIDINTAGASVHIISDIIPGRGAINTQSYYIPLNQNNAYLQMFLGSSPTEIIAWLSANDAENDPTRRQYGIVDFDTTGRPRSDAFTGSNCFDYKGHIIGSGYAIQGNILLGQEILDSMEARFLATEGPLSDRLMSALQGANVPGADTRCAGEGVSSLSAYIRVAKPTDNEDSLYLDLTIAQTPFGVEPIDVLQQAYDNWKGTTGLSPTFPENAPQLLVQHDHQSEILLFHINQSQNSQPYFVEVFDTLGQKVVEFELLQYPVKYSQQLFGTGVYFYQLSQQGETINTGKFILN